MPRKVAESHSVAYLSPSAAELHDVEEGFYIVVDEISEPSDHVNSDGEEYSVRHDTNYTPVRRVFPAPDGGEGFVYGDEEGGDED